MFYHKKSLISFSIALLYVVSIIFILPRSYMVNDDLGLLSFFKINAIPPTISFPIPFARLFGFLYQNISDSIPWYGIYLYIILYLTLAGALLLIANTTASLTTKIISTIFFIFFFTIFITQATFTTIAILASGVALLGYLQTENPWFNGSLLILGYLTRIQGMIGAIAIILPLIIWKSLKTPKLMRSSQLVIFIVPLTILIIINQILGLGLSQADQFHQTHIKSQLALEFLKLSPNSVWNDNDIYLYKSWFFIDENKFSPVNMKAIEQTGTPLNWWNWQSINNLLTNLWQARATAFGLLGWYLLSFIWVKRTGRIWILAYFLYFITWSLYMTVTYKFPERVALPFSYIVALGLYWLSSFYQLRTTFSSIQSYLKSLRLLYIITATILLIEATRSNILTIQQQITNHKLYHQDLIPIQQLTQAIPNSWFLIVPTLPLINSNDPLIANPLPDNWIFTGWTTFSGLFYHKIQQQGIKTGQQVLPKMVDNNQAFLILNQHLKEPVEQFIKQTYHFSHIKLNLVAQLTSDSNIRIYSLTSK